MYGSIVSEGSKYPVLLSLDDITGYQGSADTIFATALKALGCMELQDGKNIIAVTTDNPIVMQAFQYKMNGKFPRVLVSNQVLTKILRLKITT